MLPIFEDIFFIFIFSFFTIPFLRGFVFFLNKFHFLFHNGKLVKYRIDCFSPTSSLQTFLRFYFINHIFLHCLIPPLSETDVICHATGLDKTFSLFSKTSHCEYLQHYPRKHKRTSFDKIFYAFTAARIGFFRDYNSRRRVVCLSKRVGTNRTSLSIYTFWWVTSILSTLINVILSAIFFSVSSFVTSTNLWTRLLSISLLLSVRILYGTQALQLILLTKHRFNFWTHTFYQLFLFVCALN